MRQMSYFPCRECGSQYGLLTFNTWLPRTVSSSILTDFQCEHTFCQVLIPEISYLIPVRMYCLLPLSP